MNSTEKKIPQKVFEFLKEEKIPPASTMLVALSGGPDSTALLLSLCELQKSIHYSIKAAYVNHGMRREDQLLEDDHFVRDLTSHLNVELFSLHVPPGEIDEVSSNEGRSSEEVARNYRYRFFSKILSRYDRAYLLLGHNRDDQYETLISRFFQGSGVSGLKGIPHKNKNILRPLIHCRKKDILKYLSDSKQKFCFDPTNDENAYQRNKIRNKLIPLIEEIFPGYAKSLNSQEERFLSLEEFIQIETDRIHCSYNTLSCSVQIDSFNIAHVQIRRNLLYRMFDYSYRGNIQGFRVPDRFFSGLLYSKLERDRVYAKSYGIKIFTDEKTLIFKVHNDLATGYSYRIEDRTTEIAGKFILTQGDTASVKIEVVEGSPLIVRSAAVGDSIQSAGKKITIKKLYRRWGVSGEDKNIIPLVADSSGIVAVLGESVGYKNEFRVKNNIFTENFDILYLRLREIMQK